MGNKQYPSFRDAVADIPDGATVAFGGFAMPGTPFNLIKALAEHGAKRLTCIANTTGGAQQPRLPDIGLLVDALTINLMSVLKLRRRQQRRIHATLPSRLGTVSQCVGATSLTKERLEARLLV